MAEERVQGLGSYKHGNDPSGSIKKQEFLGQWGNCIVVFHLMQSRFKKNNVSNESCS
jgi:hypothetical protein